MNKNNNPSTTTQYATPFDVDNNSESSYSSISFFQKVSLLPDSIKNIMANPSTAEFIEENIGPSFNLTSEQKTEVTRIIRDILLGDAPLSSTPDLISSKLNTDQNTSVQIANKIVSDLFGPAIEDIKKLQNERPQENMSRPTMPSKPQIPRIPERPDLKIEPDINRNNVVDLRNK